MSHEYAVMCRDLRKHFGTQEVLCGANLTVPAGSVVGLVGPSGSGKSTLVSMIVGTAQPAGGTVEVLGGSPGAPSTKSRVGYMPQATALYEDLTARENLSFFGALYGVRRGDLQKAIPRALDAAQLGDTGRKLVGDFSGGMARRLSLAVALLHEPELLVLDEPTVGLDPRHRIALWRTFRDLATDGRSLLITTHVMQEAESCDTVTMLFDGRVLASGSPDDLKRRTTSGDLEAAFLHFQDDWEQEEADA